MPKPSHFIEEEETDVGQKRAKFGILNFCFLCFLSFGAEFFYFYFFKITITLNMVIPPKNSAPKDKKQKKQKNSMPKIAKYCSNLSYISFFLFNKVAWFGH